MDNPHEERQVVLLERIIKNVDKCNEAVMEMNHSLQEILQANLDITTTSSLFENYSRNVVYNLEAIGKLPEPK